MKTIQIRPAAPLPVEQIHHKETSPSLADVEAVVAQYDRVIVPVAGDCLEGVSVMDGGYVLVDFTHRPAPPRFKSKGGDGSSDLCLCYAAGTLMLKEYQGVWGPWQMVGTRYKSMWDGDKLRLNGAIRADKILGVVTTSWAPDGTLLWERDPETFPTELPAAPTIHGEVEPV